MQEKTAKKRIVYLDRGSLPDRFKIRSPKVAHEWVNYTTTPLELVAERCIAAEVIITNKVEITKDTIIACPNIKHIAVSATGFNIIDTDACREFGVSISNIPSYAATTVAEHVITSALCLRRELLSYRNNVINNEWQLSASFCRLGKPINDLEGSTFGVIGFGELGKATALKAAALGMRVIYASRSLHKCEFAEQVSFQELISTADIISLHCSLTPDTTNLISANELEQMQNHAILINTARGGVANEEDVVNAINKNQIGGVAFDVLCQEPPINNSPLLSISALDNVIITPHSAWASEQSMQSLVNILADNIDAFLLGSPQNIVT